MTVVADSSPLVILAKLGCFDLLNMLFPRVYISAEVHHEVVVAGAEDASGYIRDLAQLGDADVEAMKILYSVQHRLFTSGSVPTDPNPYTEVIGEVLNAVDRFRTRRVLLTMF